MILKFIILLSLFILWQVCTYIAYKCIYKDDTPEDSSVPDIVIPVDPSINELDENVTPVFLEKE